MPKKLQCLNISRTDVDLSAMARQSMQQLRLFTETICPNDPFDVVVSHDLLCRHQRVLFRRELSKVQNLDCAGRVLERCPPCRNLVLKRELPFPQVWMLQASFSEPVAMSSSDNHGILRSIVEK